MPDKLMSEERHMQLIKAAEETIGLMNIGIDGEAALAKIADDNVMNDHEVELVAHAVNNSKQLAHIQESAPEDRDKSFPVINSDGVRAQRQEPITNADVNTDDRYAPQEDMGDSTEQKQDENDSLDTQDKILKDAAATTWKSPGDFRRRAETPDYATALREGWGLQETKVAHAEYENPNPYAKNDYIRIGIEEARVKAAEARNACEGALDKLAYTLRYASAPKFARLEKIAYAAGVSEATMNLVYHAAGLEGLDERLQEKTASEGRIYITSTENEYLQDCVRADTMWKAAADATAACRILSERLATANAALDKVAADVGDRPPYYEGNLMGAPVNVSSTIDPGELGEPIGKAPEEFFAGEEAIRGALGTEGGGDEIDTLEKALPQDVRQGMENLEGRATIEDLMQDEYIGGHSLPDVVDAYNAAISVNPDFAHSKAQLISYMRQHLATKGGVPLDLQLKARPKGTGDSSQ